VRAGSHRPSLYFANSAQVCVYLALHLAVDKLMGEHAQFKGMFVAARLRVQSGSYICFRVVRSLHIRVIQQRCTWTITQAADAILTEVSIVADANSGVLGCALAVPLISN
jgi:hypothetical protein